MPWALTGSLINMIQAVLLGQSSVLVAAMFAAPPIPRVVSRPLIVGVQDDPLLLLLLLPLPVRRRQRHEVPSGVLQYLQY